MYLTKSKIINSLLIFSMGTIMLNVFGKDKSKDNEIQIYENYGQKKIVTISEEEARKRLKKEEYEILREESTERAFSGEYWDNKEEGIYVDRLSGEPLFTSKEKYKSGTGWPSFWAPISKEFITEHEDKKLWSVRVEVRSKLGDNHLGHVFNDGPKPTGLRYCINSASLRFISVENLEKEGYGEFLKLFK
ncbi:MAG: peptide-methionine (R)-S-oxide reductase MsrB [Halobacteriovoraceae bacterium]|nr:peptide-methionine (R)-S-oxide reductase MsrB [Halobacteriovoraceae bacterium]